MEKSFLDELKSEALDLPWCVPPAGIPGNNPPRNVAVIGNNQSIVDDGDGNVQFEGLAISETSYPLYQCAKNSSAIYKTRIFPPNIAKLVLRLRALVREKYEDRVVNVDKMFNVGVCNFYTENRHSVSAHRDDERWLEHNQLDKHGKPYASIIASLTIYVDNPKADSIRQFEVKNDSDGSWEKFLLEDNSVILFSNHEHRMKPLSKKNTCSNRINITFRTITDGILGLTGYSNFYRYMSIPYCLNLVSDRHREHAEYFYVSASKSNKFHSKILFDEDIIINMVDDSKRKRSKKAYQSKYTNNLSKNVKPLCTIENYRKFYGPMAFKLKIPK